MDNAFPTERLREMSVVIPVYNEARAIGPTLEALSQTMQGLAIDYEVIVVDDGSRDNSAQVALDASPAPRLIRHETNQGYGAALKSGFAVARYDTLAFLDADGSYPPGELADLIEAAGQADMVVAQRVGYRDHSSWARSLGQAILMPLANYLTDCRIPDLNSGMRIVRRDLVERYWPLLPDGFSLTTTLTLALLSARRRVVWRPIEFHARTGRSKIRPLRDMTNFLTLILRTATYFKPLRVYVPISALLVSLSIAVVIVTKLVYDRVWDVTALFLFIAGLQMLLIGVVADLVLKMLGTRK